MKTPEALIEEIERQMAEQQPMFDALLAALADCDPRTHFAVAADALPEITPPRRQQPATPLSLLAMRA